MSFRDVLRWATQDAANSTGLGQEIGSITVGKRADMILVNTRNLGMFPVIDPVASIVQSGTPADVNTVIADGRIIKRNGRVLGIDLAALAAQASAGARELISS